jgi:hypothetical protein
LEYWEGESGKKAGDCGHCTKKATLGGHVKKVEGSDNSHYIVPLCDACNKISSDEEFNVYETLVSAS